MKYGQTFGCVILDTECKAYSPSEIVDMQTLTVGQLKEFLEHFDDSRPIMTTADGHLYGRITCGRISSEYVVYDGEQGEEDEG